MSTRAATRWSVFATGVEQQLVAGVLASSYGGAYVALLERGGQHSVLDLLAFVCFAGIGVTGAMNVVRGLASLRGDAEAALCLAVIPCGASWVYTSLAPPGGITGGEAMFYGGAAAAALAAWIDAHRSRDSSQWMPIGPVAVFALWSVAQALEETMTYRYAAIIVSVVSLTGILLLRRRTHA